MISRRLVVGGLAGLTAARPLEALADVKCNTAFGARTCEASVHIDRFEPVRQRCENWCWAACIQTVFALSGYAVRQERAVVRLFGSSIICEGANVNQMISAIDGDWTDDNGKKFSANGRALLGGNLPVATAGTGAGAPRGLQGYADVAATQIVNLLTNNKPLIIGSIPRNAPIGHATVLAAASYDVQPLPSSLGGIIGPEAIRFRGLTILDPWAENTYRRELTQPELEGAMYAVAVTITPR